MKRVFCLVMLLFVIGILAINVVGLGILEPTYKSEVFIFDDDSVIDDEIQKSLNSILMDLENQTTVEFVIISAKSLREYTIEEYVDKAFNAMQLGEKYSTNSILLLFSQSDNQVRIEVGNDLESVLNDATCGRILDDNFLVWSEKGEYSKAVEQTVNTIVSIIAEEYNVEIDGVQDSSDLLKREIIFWSIIVVVLFILFMLPGTSDSRTYGIYMGDYSRDEVKK